MAPEVIVYADSVRVPDSLAVAETPELLVYVRDNARVPFSDTSLVGLRLNNIPGEGTEFYKTYTRSTLPILYQLPEDCKLAVRCRTKLEKGINTFDVLVTDIFGNKKTYTYYLHVANRIAVRSSTIRPNPANSDVVIRYEFNSDRQNQLVVCEVFNVQGQLVRRIHMNSRIGTNDMRFELRDEEGNTLPIGSYYYRIYVENLSSLDAQFGSFSIVR
jgi:hypothetical protein